MPKLCPITPKKFCKILIYLGFEEIRIRGSHHFFFNNDTKKTTVIPIHSNEMLGSGILKEIFRDIELSVEEYEKLRTKV